MSVQYISNEKGKITAVQLPIKEWELIKQLYPGVENIDAPLPSWQKKLIDKRLEAIEKNPERLKPVEGLFHELDL